MAQTISSWVPERDNLLVVTCCLLAIIAAFNYLVGAYGGTIVATVGAGIALLFLVLLSD